MSNDPVNHPQHYTEGPGGGQIECIQITQHLDFCSGNAFKYVWRAGIKGGREKLLEDLRKAQWYLSRMVNYRLDLEGERVYRASGVFLMVQKPPQDDTPGFHPYNAYRILSEIVKGHYAQASLILDTVLEQETEKENIK